MESQQQPEPARTASAGSAGKRQPASGRREKAERQRRRRAAGQTREVPRWDPAAATRVVPRVHLQNIELLGAHFERSDDQPIPEHSVSDAPPDIGINVAWNHDPQARMLGCVLTFGATFEQDGPYSLIAQFRLLYSIDEGDPLAENDIEHFVHWNATFNAWPYWREYLSSTINRANLPRFLLPVMRVPMAQ
jgi:preprotein translocase subunit SecB